MTLTRVQRETLADLVKECKALRSQRDALLEAAEAALHWWTLAGPTNKHGRAIETKLRAAIAAAKGEA